MVQVANNIVYVANNIVYVANNIVYVGNDSYQFYVAGHWHYLNTVMEPQPSLASGEKLE